MTTNLHPHGYGDDEPCWQDPTHGATYRMGSGRGWCPSSLHKGSQLAPISRSAPDLPAPNASRRGAQIPIPEQMELATTG